MNNCILWGNTPAQICQSYNSQLIIRFCDIEGGIGGIDNSSGAAVVDVGNNFYDDPLFVDADGPDDILGNADDNLRLSADSNCIDAGDNNSVPNDTADLDGDGNTTESIPWDLEGHPKIIDGDCNDTDVVDMGAYEFNYAYMGDFDYQCDVDFVDYAIFALAWLSEPGDEKWNRFCDISTPADNSVDMLDLAVFVTNWLAGPE